MVRAPRIRLLALLLAGFAAAAESAAVPAAAVEAAVDAIFREYDSPDGPGCSVAVIDAGKVVFQKDYGMANVSLGVPRTRTNSHWIPYSEARVFVALAVAMLAREGKLGLDDPVRRHIPQLPEYASDVTVRHLLHHTSGLADYGVLDFAFNSMESRVSEDEFFRVLQRWGRLGFVPGQGSMYSNTDYALLKMLVERTSGGTLHDFLHARLLGRLGMADTRIGADQATVYPGHALFYESPADGGGQVLRYRSSPTGGISVTTHLDDLVRWDAGLRDPRLGLGALLASLEPGAPQAGSGADGLRFSFGMHRRTYRGLPVVAYQGIGNYAYLVQVQDSPLSVATLCNAYPGMDRFGFEVAHLFAAPANGSGAEAGAASPPAPASPGPPVELSPSELAMYAGTYRNASRRFTADFRVVGKQLEFTPRGGKPFPLLTPVGGGRFVTEHLGSTFLLTFVPSEGGMRMSAWDLTRNEPGGEDLLRWTPPTWPTAGVLASYAGTYEGVDVDATLFVRVDGNQVWVASRGRAEMALDPADAPDRFNGPDIYTSRFERDSQGRVVALVLDASRVKGIRYQRRDGPPRVPVFDGHVDVMVHFAKPDYSGWNAADSYDLGGPAKGQVDIPRLQRGRVAGGLFTVAVLDPDRGKGVRDAMALLRAIAARHEGSLAVVADSAELEQARRAGRVAMLPGIEGGEQLGGKLETLRAAHAAGVRALTLTWTRSNELGDSSGDVARHGGLSELGGGFVDEMNRLGMLVDLSHAADDTVRDVLARTKAPVIFSHSSARALCESPRSLPDDLLRAVARNGGLVMVPFVPYMLRKDYLDWYEAGEAEWARLKAAHPGDEATARTAMTAWEAANAAPAVSLADVADHIEHVRKVAGIDHVGIGSDFDGMYSNVPGLEDPSRLPALFAELARRGWSEAELRQLGYGNFLRVLRAVEKP